MDYSFLETLCAFPAGLPADGEISNFTNPVSLTAVTFAIGCIMTTWAVVLAAARIFVNAKNLGLGDCKTFVPGL